MLEGKGGEISSGFRIKSRPNVFTSATLSRKRARLRKKEDQGGGSERTGLIGCTRGAVTSLTIDSEGREAPQMPFPRYLRNPALLSAKG